MTDPAGTISSANATVTVTDGTAIVTQPRSATILAGTSQTLEVEATGAGLSYQWHKDGTAIAGATSATYDATETGTYDVVLTNAAGNVASSSAAVAVSATLAAPAITTQPAAQTVNSGMRATFAVGVSGTSVAYQWYRNGTGIV
ncbi:hypothetical protein [Massilia sp.]|uniref:hypothetical protein n=1 Tax=Massilia sp. TaxID=1882437 RepID=UPI00352E8029